MNPQAQYLREASLLVVGQTEIIDLSELQFKFQVNQSTRESPNSASIRVYNLSEDTAKRITGKSPVEFTGVKLKAGYQGQSSQIFSGTIKQFRKGRENALNSYLDILAAENDPEYNFGVCNTNAPAGFSVNQTIGRVADQIQLKFAAGQIPQGTGGTLPRGKVLWGMARNIFRNEAQSQRCSWSIQDGSITMIPLDGYLPGEAVVITAATGMIGVPQQTDEGINVRTLLNPKLKIGARIKLDNASINTTQAQESSKIEFSQFRFDSRTGRQVVANTSLDGFYFLYVIEHGGDTRGNEWFSDLICLAIDPNTDKVISNA